LIVIFHFTHIERLQIASTRDVQVSFFILSRSSTSVRIDNEKFRDIDIGVYSRFFST